LLTEPADGLADCFSIGEELDTYRHLEELMSKIETLLNAPQRRDGMARAGHERVRREHTYEIRLAQLLERARPIRAARSALGLDQEAFDVLAMRHRPGLGLRLLRGMLVMPGILVWGRQRGPRAARRLLFELSWRVAGRHTYTAAGWPGRLFYRES
jgi:spore maturation protein CgeB